MAPARAVRAPSVSRFEEDGRCFSLFSLHEQRLHEPPEQRNSKGEGRERVGGRAGGRDREREARGLCARRCSVGAWSVGARSVGARSVGAWSVGARSVGARSVLGRLVVSLCWC
jgi:hypothetical protein